jgi:IMP dehydrogenase
MNEPRLALTYDDVLLVPRRSAVRSRADVSTRSCFTRRIELAVPLVSANMDTVTTAPMAIAMAELGGIGVIHRFLPTAGQAAEVKRVKRYLTRVIAEPYTVGPERTVREARAEAGRLGVTGLLVVDAERRPLGILTARDMRAAPGASVAEAMTPAARLVTGPPEIALEQARQLLDRHRVEKLPLVDGDGRLTGLITLRDLESHGQFPHATRDQHGRLRVAAAVGVRGGYLARAEALLAAGVDALVLDIAHGHAEHAIEAVRELKAAWPDAELVAGNVATPDGFRDLVEAGADAVKVGIGPGLACTTRLVAGVGVPQLTAVLDCATAARASGTPLIADGGVRHPGDVAKAIAAGASTVMVGGLFAGRAESPGEVVRRRGQLFKVFRGMASQSAAAARLAIEGRGDALDQYVPEGEELEFPLKGPVAEVVNELAGGLRSGMSYVGAATVEECWRLAGFVRQTDAGRREARTGDG